MGVSDQFSSFQLLSHVRLFVTPWTVANQAPRSMKFSRQEYWSRLPFPSPRDLPNPGIEPKSPELAGRFFPAELPEMPYIQAYRGTYSGFQLVSGQVGFNTVLSQSLNSRSESCDVSFRIRLQHLLKPSLSSVPSSFRYM